MKIETKFKEGDKIFFISGALKVVSSIVRGFRIEREHKKKTDYVTTITYFCNEKPDEIVNIRVEESNAFKSKEELLKSL